MDSYENDAEGMEMFDSLPKERVCCRCGGHAMLYFYLEQGAVCSACCDRLELDEVLHLFDAQSVSDLLCEFGYELCRS